MSDLLAISVAHNNARLAASIAFADLGSNPSRIQFYATSRPGTAGGSAGGAPLVEVVLTKPCATIVANKLVLTQDDADGDLIATTGAALWGRWLNGNGDLVGDADASDDAGTGFFKIAGTTGTTLFAGARALLGTVEIT